MANDLDVMMKLFPGYSVICSCAVLIVCAQPCLSVCLVLPIALLPAGNGVLID